MSRADNIECFLHRNKLSSCWGRPMTELVTDNRALCRKDERGRRTGAKRLNVVIKKGMRFMIAKYSRHCTLINHWNENTSARDYGPTWIQRSTTSSGLLQPSGKLFSLESHTSKLTSCWPFDKASFSAYQIFENTQRGCKNIEIWQKRRWFVMVPPIHQIRGKKLLMRFQ